MAPSTSGEGTKATNDVREHEVSNQLLAELPVRLLAIVSYFVSFAAKVCIAIVSLERTLRSARETSKTADVRRRANDGKYQQTLEIRPPCARANILYHFTDHEPFSHDPRCRRLGSASASPLQKEIRAIYCVIGRKEMTRAEKRM